MTLGFLKPGYGSCPALDQAVFICLFAQDEGPRDTVDRKVSDLEFSEAELMGEEGMWASG